MQPTKGEVNFYNKIKNGSVRAVKGKSDAGDGWRPVCAGSYLGNQCSSTEWGAIAQGLKIVSDLKLRVELMQQYEANEESPPVPIKKKRTRKIKEE